ncbi:c-type cytochrome [Belliella pelovolcani]|uniref:c-type cytochrome n=1 Tax=Belliella pelovolcani TaxID=529505 RepID=UPI003918D680
MKESFEPFVKLISLMVSLLLIVATFTALVIGTVLYISEGGKLPRISFVEKTSPPMIAEDPEFLALVSSEGMWIAPEWSSVEQEANADMIKYGRELIANTSEYLGPNGKVMKISNGMNCQNCHLNAGTAPLGNNYAAVSTTYPKVRARSGQSEDIPKRINDCFERSLNGEGLPIESKEMQAMVAYMEWLGKDVPKGETPKGAGIYAVAFLERPANPVAGKRVYDNQCASCHMEDGQGVLRFDGLGYTYPPLWGDHSYNDGAGLYRMSRFAGYVKANMPLGATYERPMLTDEQAWDVAAYVNSMARPAKDISNDWPDISKKPVDHPFGPFTDQFTEEQHKFGPFKPILEAQAMAKNQ